MHKNYTVAKKNTSGEIALVNYKKISGFKIAPKNKIHYPGVEVNSMLIIKPSFIEKILKRKSKIKLNNYLNYIVEQADDDSDDSLREALNNISRYKEIVEYKYRKYLDDKYINLLAKKLDMLERKIKSKLIYKEFEYTEEKEMTGKSR